MRQRLVFVFILLSFFIDILNSQSVDSVQIIKIDINSSLSEISAEFSNGILYFYRNKRFYQRLSPYYDLHMISKKDLNEGKGLKSIVTLSDKIKGTSHYHEGPIFIDAQENKMYLTLNAYNKEEYKEAKENEGVEINRLRIVEADFKNGEIFNIKEFPFNDPGYSMGHAAYSKVTKRLYFASNRLGGKGKSDIYYSQKLQDGSWLEPVNIGDKINTEGDEMFPYVKDSLLFFTSNKQRGNPDGDFDIYFVSEFDIQLSLPERLPDGINSTEDDFAICFEDSSSYYVGYFTSNRGNSLTYNDDIYGFRITRKFFKSKYTQVLEIVNQYGDGVPNAKIVIKDDKGNIIAESFTDNNGKVSFYGLTKGNNYTIEYENDTTKTVFQLNPNNTLDYVEESFEIYQEGAVVALPEDLGVFSFERKSDSLENSEMRLVRDNEGRSIDVRLKKIHFAFNSAKIYPYSARKLDFIVDYFNSINAKYIYFEAHTDCRASDSYNLALSDRRAQSCREYLVSKGIPDEKIKFKGMGESMLLNKCDDGIPCPDEMHLENRRIEFKMVY